MILSYFYQENFRRSLGDIRCFSSLPSFMEPDTCQRSCHGEENADMTNITTWGSRHFFFCHFSNVTYIYYSPLILDVASNYTFNCNSSRLWKGSKANNLFQWIWKMSRRVRRPDFFKVSIVYRDITSPPPFFFFFLPLGFSTNIAGMIICNIIYIVM